jgi:CheY-like chemotaxis protein
VNKVIVVDDEPFVRTTLAMLLRMEGYAVRVAEHAAQALELARADCPDLILSDLHMPGMSGGELLAAVRSDPSLQQVRFVFLTGDAQAPAGGGPTADGVLMKPFTRDQLLALLEGLKASAPRP